MGRGRKKRDRDGGGRAEDQYGETFVSQDRPMFHPSSRGGGSGGGGSMRGGGTAGGRGRSSMDVSFERHVPKFLQKYQNLLGPPQGPAQQGDDDDPTVVQLGVEAGARRDSGGGSKEDADDEADAIARALEENPELAAELGETAVSRARAQQAKELGNDAFKAKDWRAAVRHFSRAIELNNKDEVYWSNRAAAYAALKEWDLSLADGRQAVTLKPKWAKGWARVAVACFGQEDYRASKDAYERALAIEPHDDGLRKGLEKAMIAEAKDAASSRHKFRRRAAAHSRPDRSKTGGVDDKVKDRKLLSFGDEEDGDGD